MQNSEGFSLQPIGFVQSSLKSQAEAPKQGYEGAPDAWIVINEKYRDALNGISVNQEIILITWFHQAQRDILMVHPRDDLRNPLTGVFATRSQDRPNPVALHRVTVYEISGLRLRVSPLEALNGTPVIDIKPVLKRSDDA